MAHGHHRAAALVNLALLGAAASAASAENIQKPGHGSYQTA